VKPIGDFSEVFSRRELGDYLRDDPPAVLIHDAMHGSFKPASGNDGDTIARFEAGFSEGFDASGEEPPGGVSTSLPREVAFMVIPLVSQHDPENSKMIVGRTGACDIQIDDITISRRHAVIERRGEDYLIRDLGSTVSTSINGQLLEPGKSHRLSPGERVSLGTVDFTYLDAAAFYMFAKSFLVESKKDGTEP